MYGVWLVHRNPNFRQDCYILLRDPRELKYCFRTGGSLMGNGKNKSYLRNISSLLQLLTMALANFDFISMSSNFINPA